MVRDGKKCLICEPVKWESSVKDESGGRLSDATGYLYLVFGLPHSDAGDGEEHDAVQELKYLVNAAEVLSLK